jgi:hypothetical protein
VRRQGVLVGLAILAAGCGGTNLSPKQSEAAKRLAFSRCVRAHGIADFPDVRGDGAFTIPRDDRNSPLLKSATRSCTSLLPPDQLVSAATQARWRAQGGRFARCMRAHGVVGFPDPGPTGVIDLVHAGPVVRQPGYAAAQSACRSLAGGAAFVLPG